MSAILLAFRTSWIAVFVVLIVLSCVWFVIRVIVDFARWFKEEIIDDFRRPRRRARKPRPAKKKAADEKTGPPE